MALKIVKIINYMVGGAWLGAFCPPKPLYPSAVRGTHNTMEGSWIKIRVGKDHSALTAMGKTELT